MSTYLVRASALFFLGISAVICRADTIAASAAALPENPNVRQAREARQKLAVAISLDKGIEPNTKLQDALDFIADRYGLTLLVDSQAFKTDLSLDNVGEMVVALPRMKDVKLSTVLRMLAAQLGGTYLVMSDHVLITTPQRARPEEWVGPHRNCVPTVSVDFDKRSLDEALKELSSLTGINILLDPRVAESGKTPLTTTLSNAPLDTAVQLLADMAGLGSVVMDGMLYVTSQEHASHLKEEQEKNKGSDKATPKADDKGVVPAPTKQTGPEAAKKPQK